MAFGNVPIAAKETPQEPSFESVSDVASMLRLPLTMLMLAFNFQRTITQGYFVKDPIDLAHMNAHEIVQVGAKAGTRDKMPMCSVFDHSRHTGTVGLQD